MIIESASGSIELDISVPVGPGQGRRADIAVSWGDFRARRAEIWIEHGEFERFLQDLRTFERTRQGRVILAADDPREFKLILAATDKAGHLKVSGRVGSPQATDGIAA